MRILLACIIAWASLLSSRQRELKLEHLTTANGLSHNTVSYLFQDSRGFLWIGTIDGLNRYDGYSFKIFRHDERDSNSISSSFIHTIAESRDGIVWVGTRDGGLNAFDPKTERFRHYRHDPHDAASIPDDKVGFVLEDERGFIWLGTDKGIAKLDRSRGVFTSYRHDAKDPSSISNEETTEMLLQPDGTLWVGTQNGMDVFDRATERFTTFYPTPRSRISLGDNYVVMMLPNSRNEVWVGTYRSTLYLFDRSRKTFERIGPGHPRLPGLTSRTAVPRFLDSNEDLYLATPSALEVYGKEGTLAARALIDPTDPTALQGMNITHVAKDRSGTMWFSTWGNGVYKLAKRFQDFRTFQRDQRNKHSINSNFILALMEDRNQNLWVGTGGGGLNRIDGRTGFAQPLHTDDNMVWCAMEQIDGSVWVGTQRGGIEIFSSTGVRLRTFTMQNGGSPDNNIRVLMRDSKNTVWAGSQKHGLMRYDGRKKLWHPVPLGGSDSLVWAITEDRNHTLWLGSLSGGAARFDPQTGRCEWFRHDAADSSSLSFNDVRTVYETADGEIWLGTYGGGLNRWNPVTRTFAKVTTANGLANDFIYGILEDAHGNLWVSTNNGVSKYDRRTHSFTNFTDRNGLQGNEFNTGAYFRSPSGEMFFGGVGGYTRFFPDDVQFNHHKPAVVLISFKVFDKELRADTSITAASAITLQYSQNFFSFEFAALEFTDPQRNLFAYALEGFDPGWINSGTRRYASYTNLDPGEYVFRVKASNNDGVWNETGTSIRVSIVPPFYVTVWFRILAVLGMVGVVAGVVRWSTQRKMQRQIQELEHERAMQQERERISRDLHDNAGAQMANIISGLELAEKYSKVAPAKAKRLMRSLSGDARSGMGQLRETIWAMNTNATELAAFVERVESFTKRQMLYRKSRRIVVENKVLVPLTLTPMQTLNLFRIVQEAISNALKYSRGNKILVSFALANGTFALAVEDEGTSGVSVSHEMSGGQGILNMERRASELGGSFRMVRNRKKGTTVRVEIPLTANTANGGLKET